MIPLSNYIRQKFVGSVSYAKLADQFPLECRSLLNKAIDQAKAKGEVFSGGGRLTTYTSGHCGRCKAYTDLLRAESKRCFICYDQEKSIKKWKTALEVEDREIKEAEQKAAFQSK